MTFRSLPDIRQFPLYVSLLQSVNATIPAFDIGGSLFHALLLDNDLGREWGWVMMLSGIYLMFASLYNRRQSLHIGLFLCALVWSAMAVLVADVWWQAFTYLGHTQHWVTPITLTMPITAFFLWFCLYREMKFCPTQIIERRKTVRS